jgi:small-conductance mechanosensitive channel
MIEFLTTTPWVTQAAAVIAGVLLGVLTERFLVGAVHRLAERTQSTWDDLVIEAINWMPLVWWSAAGVWAASRVRGLTPLTQTRVNQALGVVIIVSFTIIAMRLASGSIRRYAERTQAGLPSTSLVNNLVNLVIVVLGLFLVLQNLDIQITPLITALGIGGLAVALALQDTLSNLFAGVSIIVAGQVRKNDYIRLDTGQEGFVADVKARNTTIRTFPHRNLVVVPNGVLASTIVTNYSLPQRNLWISVPVGVAYDSDLERVEKVSIEVGKEVLEALDGRAPTADPLVRYEAFADSSINFNVLLPASRFTDQFLIRHEFIKRLHARFERENIEIPFPIRTLYVRTPGAAATEP